MLGKIRGAHTQRERNTIIIIINFIVRRAVRRSNIPRISFSHSRLLHRYHCVVVVVVGLHTFYTCIFFSLFEWFASVYRAMSSTATPSDIPALVHFCIVARESACACLRCLWNCSNGIYFAYFYCLCAREDVVAWMEKRRKEKSLDSPGKHEHNGDDAASNHWFWMLLQANKSVQECNSQRSMVVVAKRR